ncbi:MAG: hypothetical protein IIT32_02845 [Bacteroidales bacterium]|nr:hypothetical protein [Bacteroidales bacterium]
MTNKIFTKQEVINLINAGHVMLLSGSDKALSNLPKGKWVAGTTPYFMDGTGKVDEENIFVDDFTDIAKNAKVEVFDTADVHNIAKHGYDNGFIVMSLPIDTEIYFEFSNKSLEYEGIYNNPLVGFVACCNFNDYGNFGQLKTFVGAGNYGQLFHNKAVALYVELPDNITARAEIINLDTIDYSTPKVVFPKTSFFQSDCTIDGKPGNIAEYMEKYVKPRMGGNGYTQMITSQNGALINRDPKVVDLAKGTTSFFSPAYAGDEYYLVKPGNDYLAMFNEALKAKKSEIVACFSCISYFFGGSFEGKSIIKNGCYAFGEIAYQLLNKTIVTLEIDRA